MERKASKYERRRSALLSFLRQPLAQKSLARLLQETCEAFSHLDRLVPSFRENIARVSFLWRLQTKRLSISVLQAQTKPSPSP